MCLRGRFCLRTEGLHGILSSAAICPKHDASALRTQKFNRHLDIGRRFHLIGTIKAVQSPLEVLEGLCDLFGPV